MTRELGGTSCGSFREDLRRPRECVTVLGVQPDDTFIQILSQLCAWTTVVTVEPRTGGSFDAVLLACGESVVFYECWDGAAGTPGGDLGAIGVADIVALRVAY